MTSPLDELREKIKDIFILSYPVQERLALWDLYEASPGKDILNRTVELLHTEITKARNEGYEEGSRVEFEEAKRKVYQEGYRRGTEYGLGRMGSTKVAEEAEGRDVAETILYELADSLTFSEYTKEAEEIVNSLINHRYGKGENL